MRARGDWATRRAARRTTHEGSNIAAGGLSGRSGVIKRPGRLMAVGEVGGEGGGGTSLARRRRAGGWIHGWESTQLHVGEARLALTDVSYARHGIWKHGGGRQHRRCCAVVEGWDLHMGVSALDLARRHMSLSPRQPTTIKASVPALQLLPPRNCRRVGLLCSPRHRPSALLSCAHEFQIASPGCARSRHALLLPPSCDTKSYSSSSQLPSLPPSALSDARRPPAAPTPHTTRAAARCRRWPLLERVCFGCPARAPDSRACSSLAAAPQCEPHSSLADSR